MVIVIYILVDMLLFSNGFLVVLILQLFIILLAISPIGEAIIRYIYGGKRLKTRNARNYLLPIFFSVYENVLDEKPKTSRRIKLYLDRSMTPNAYAVGSNTIVVTRGAVETFSPEELQGIIAHEFGHLYNGDTILLMILLGSNIYFLIIFLLVKMVEIIINIVNALLGGFSRYNIAGKIILWLFRGVVALLVLITQGILSINQRNNEYNADEFAEIIGFGENLISALYTLDSIDYSDGKISFLERLKNSHPDIENRIEILERY